MEFGNKNANLTTLFTNTLSCLSLNDNFKAPWADLRYANVLSACALVRVAAIDVAIPSATPNIHAGRLDLTAAVFA